jgi:hypothetical protein
MVVASGLLAGGVHVITGIDHLAALLPLAVGRRLRALGAGARWGLGHSAGVLIVGLLALALRERFDLHATGAWGERAVGVMLMVLGALGVRRGRRLRVHAHPHAHEPGHVEHAHLHAHFAPHLAEHAQDERGHGHAAFAAGTLHGVAGSAHLLGVLPALALPGRVASGAYLGAFALGTVAAMAAFAALVGENSARLAVTPRLARAAVVAAGALTFVIGGLWLIWTAQASTPHS